MAGGFSINAGLNASKFLRGVKDMDGALEDLSGSLDDVADEVKKLDKGDGFKDLKKGADKAEDSASDLEKRLRKVRDEAKDIGKAGDDVGDIGGRGFRKMGDTAEEVSGELRQNLGETFSSFRGDLEDLPQVAQDVFGGLAGSVGGLAGSLALAAGAAGIGLLIAQFQAADEAAKESAERAGEWADAYIEAGSKTLTFEQQAAKVSAIITDQSGRYKVAEENAKLWGVSIDTAVAAMAGSESAISEVTSALDKKREASEKDAAAAQAMAEANGSALTALTPAEVEYNKAKDALNLLTGEMERGAQGADVYSRFLVDTARATEGAIEKTDEFGDTIITLPDGKEVYIDAETGRATDNVNAIQSKIYGVRGTTVGVGVDTSGASRDVDRFVSQNNGRTIKFYGKYISPAGSSIP